MHLLKKKLSLILLAAVMCLTLSLAVARAQEDGSDGLYDSVPASEIDPEFAIEWMDTLYARIQADGVNAPAASRLYAYAAVTLYESILPGMSDNNTLIGQIQSLTDLPWPTDDALHDWPAVADAAMDTVLTGIFPDSPDSQEAFHTLRTTHLALREAETSAEIIARSVAFGESIGESLLTWISGDGYAERVTEYTPNDDLSTWVTTGENQRAVEPGWGSIRPLILESADVCDIPTNVPFSTDENSVFYAQAMEVMTVGDNLTDEQREIAEFWIDTPGQSGTPAGHWVHISEDMIRQEGFMLNRAAETYAMMGLGLMDSFIATWNHKYNFPLLRPLTYINTYINPRWQTYLATPGFPEYPSGHSVVSGAAATILTSYFGGPRAFSNENILPGGTETATRSFTSFWEAANEAAISRMYGGIHYRAAIENGVEMGRCIGTYITDHIRLNPIRQGE